MYYKSVNRGLAFTKPGLYIFGIVLVLGMLAVISGVNGFYLLLCSLLGSFVVSGVLSERAIACFEVRQISGVQADADQSFNLQFLVENTSAWFSLFGINNLLMFEYPKYRLYAKVFETAKLNQILSVYPGSTQLCTMKVKGLERGLYEKLIMMQSTSYPFGILEKYKFKEFFTSIVVAPAFNSEFSEKVRKSLRTEIQSISQGGEFFGHSIYRNGEKHGLDWRKNANKSTKDWVVKTFKDPIIHRRLVVKSDWLIAVNARSSEMYEGYLSNIRTALSVAKSEGFEVWLFMAENLTYFESDQQIRTLASAPKFADRREYLQNMTNKLTDQSRKISRELSQGQDSAISMKFSTFDNFEIF